MDKIGIWTSRFGTKTKTQLTSSSFNHRNITKKVALPLYERDFFGSSKDGQV